jgi:hypothetical protein
MKTLAGAPAVLQGYLNVNGALAGGVLRTLFRVQIALTGQTRASTAWRPIRRLARWRD